MEGSLQLVALVAMIGGIILQSKAHSQLSKEELTAFEIEPRSIRSNSSFILYSILALFLILTFIMSYLRTRGAFHIPSWLLMTVAGTMIFLIWKPKHPKQVTEFKDKPLYRKYNRGSLTLFLIAAVSHIGKYSLPTQP